MMRLLQIELMKVRKYRIFWIMSIIYILALSFIFFGFPSLVDYFSMRSDSTEIKLLKNFVYNFPDVWQNLSWVASLRFFIKIFLGFVIIMLITNEYSNLTIRTSITNGLSRADFLKSKVYFVILFSLAATIFVFLSGLILGLIYSTNTSFSAITRKLVYLAGYFVEIFAYLSFSMFLAFLIRKAGFAIAVLFAWPIIEIIIQQRISEKAAPYLPINAMNRILQTPNTSLIQYSSPDSDIKLQTYIDTGDVLVALAYAILFILLSLLILKRRDL
jgi:ABC-type transport system involved in multi-copper enzyme maturation permease subunit